MIFNFSMNEKEKRKKERLAFRSQVSWKPLEKKKEKKTGELELFREIAFSKAIMCWWVEWVLAKHRDTDWLECTKFIPLHFLTPTNFSHIKNKGMHKDLRLEESNIELVSTAYHFYEHNKQILKVYYPN